MSLLKKLPKPDAPCYVSRYTKGVAMPDVEVFDRLVVIASILKLKDWLTAKDIRSELRLNYMTFVCARTVRRDLERLQKDYGAPIKRYKRGDTYRYHLTNPNWDFKREIDSVSPRNLQALLLATELVRQFEGTPFYGGLEILARNLYARCEQRALLPDMTNKVQFLSPPAAPVEPQVWESIMTGVLENRMMRIRYQPYGKSAMGMTIAPYRLVSLENEWYLFSEKQETPRTQIRQLAVRNISSPVLNKKTFSRSSAREKEIQDMLDHRFGWFACDRDIQQVTVVFDTAIRYLLDTRSWHKKQTKRDLENGDLEICFPASGGGGEQFHFFEVRKWILAYGRFVKSVSPPKLKQYVLDDLMATLSNLAD